MEMTPRNEHSYLKLIYVVEVTFQFSFREMQIGMTPFVFFVMYITPIISQSCREYSQTCADTAACCGGCCLQGICRDTYFDCRLGGDPCTNVYCPPEEECYIYQARDCGGCGPTTECRSVTVPVAPQGNKLRETNHTIENNSIKSIIDVNVSILSVVLYICSNHCWVVY